MRDDLDELFGEIERAPAPERPQPFKFLDPYGPEDRAIFFGRESETAMLYAQFFKSQVTLVYGESGTGKSSLIDCGLRAQIPPEDALFVPVRTALDPDTALRQELARQAPFADGPPEELEALLREVIRRKHKTLVLVFDQFEEFFLFQPESVRRAFARQVAAWLDHGLDLRLVIAIREEYLARLTELEEFLPGLYQNRLWVRRMSREQAGEAITGPCQALGIAIEAELVSELLQTLTSGGQGVELPILQVVLDTLYRSAAQDDPEKPRLTRARYQALGQAQSILARFIDDRVSAYQNEAEPARQVLKTLVTAEGTRRPSSPAEIHERLLQFGSELSQERLTRLLRRLVDDRIVREDPDCHLFELRHDALAECIRQWMSGIEQDLVEVRQTLDHRLREYRQRGRLLDPDVLTYLAPYESRLHLRGELAELVAKSRQEAGRRRRRLVAWSLASVTSILVVVSVLAIIAGKAWWEARRQEAKMLAVVAEDKIRRGDACGGVQTALKAFPNSSWPLRPRVFEAETALAEALYLPFGLTLEGHGGPVMSAAFSTDGQHVITASQDETVRIWDAETGKPTTTKVDKIRTGELMLSSAFDPQGRHALINSFTKIAMYDLESGNEVWKFSPKEPSWSAVFSHDGTRIAAAFRDRSISVLSATDGKEDDKFKKEGTSVVFSPDDHLVASASRDGKVHFWNVETGEEDLPALDTHDKDARIAFDTEGRYVLTGFNKTVQIWDVMSRNAPIRTLEGHTSAVTAVAFSPDGHRVVTASRDKTIRIWDTETGETLWAIRPPGEAGFRPSASFNPVDGDRILFAGSLLRYAYIWNRKDALEFGLVPQILSVPGQRSVASIAESAGIPVNSAEFSGDGGRIVTTSSDGMVRIWDTNTGSQLPTLPHSTSNLHFATFSPDGNRIMSASTDGKASIWDIESGTPVEHKLNGDKLAVLSAVFSEDGRHVITASADGTTHVWNADTGEEIRKLSHQHETMVSFAAFSPDGHLVLTASADNAVRIWGTGPDEKVIPFEGDTGQVTSASFSSDNLYVVTVSDDGRARIWSAVTGKPLRKVTETGDNLTFASFSPDDRYVLTASRDGTAKVWEWNREGGELQVFELLGHRGKVNWVRYSRDGQYIVTASDDGTARIWRRPSDLHSQLAYARRRVERYGDCSRFHSDPNSVTP